jgi:hypothetical protein
VSAVEVGVAENSVETGRLGEPDLFLRLIWTNLPDDMYARPSSYALFDQTCNYNVFARPFYGDALAWNLVINIISRIFSTIFHADE